MCEEHVKKLNAGDKATHINQGMPMASEPEAATGDIITVHIEIRAVAMGVASLKLKMKSTY